MNDVEIRDSVVEVLRRIAPEGDFAGLDPGENLREALEIDSFDFLNFVIGLHEKFGIDIPESDYSRLATIEGAVQYLKSGNLE